MAGVLMGAAVIAFVFMLIEKRGYKKSVRELEDAKEEYDRNREDRRREDDYRRRDEEDRRREEDYRQRDEDMKMLLMRIMGGAGASQTSGGQQGNYAYAQPVLGADEIRGIVSETMTAMLPNMQQYLPQQASANDEVLQRLIEQNEQLIEQNAANEERIRLLNEQNEERIERLIEKLSDRQNDRIIEREVAASNSNDEILQVLKEIKEIGRAHV